MRRAWSTRSSCTLCWAAVWPRASSLRLIERKTSSSCLLRVGVGVGIRVRVGVGVRVRVGARARVGVGVRVRAVARAA